MMQVHGYTEGGAISATFHGRPVSVPDNMENDHRKMIAAWEAEGNTIPEYEPLPPSVNDVVAERTRRLALGFDYDFGDARGVHHIGTTPADMEGWDEVTSFANALNQAGDTTTMISIITDSGAVDVTAPEWNAILIAAGQFRQPIWQASFVLQAMEPSPADFADDQYWP